MLVDTVDEEGIIARSHVDAPEIDCLVDIREAPDLKPGDWSDVRITHTDIHDMWAEKV